MEKYRFGITDRYGNLLRMRFTTEYAALNYIQPGTGWKVVRLY